MFLGSRLGNSLLLRFARREVGQARRVEREPHSKKRLNMQDTELERDAGVGDVWEVGDSCSKDRSFYF